MWDINDTNRSKYNSLRKEEIAREWEEVTAMFKKAYKNQKEEPEEKVRKVRQERTTSSGHRFYY